MNDTLINDFSLINVAINFPLMVSLLAAPLVAISTMRITIDNADYLIKKSLVFVNKNKRLLVGQHRGATEAPVGR